MIQQLLFLVFMGILVFYGIQITKVRMGIPFETWNLPTGYAYMAVPVNALLMGMFCIEKILRLRGETV
jgi:TRAP-type C4-dicarboxylate transport system permease small subunit